MIDRKVASVKCLLGKIFVSKYCLREVEVYQGLRRTSYRSILSGALHGVAAERHEINSELI